MIAQEVYELYKIPDNLQAHMLRTAAVAWLVCSLLNRTREERNQATVLMLLHDMGNIVKYNLDSTTLWSERDRQRPEYIAAIKAEMIEKYGDKDEVATVKIMRELEIDPKVVATLPKLSPKNLPTLVSSEAGWLEQVGAYADQRVIPTGVATIWDRIIDSLQRYVDRRELIIQGVPNALALTKIIADKALMDPEKISEVHAQAMVPFLRNFPIR